MYNLYSTTTAACNAYSYSILVEEYNDTKGYSGNRVHLSAVFALANGFLAKKALAEYWKLDRPTSHNLASTILFSIYLVVLLPFTVI